MLNTILPLLQADAAPKGMGGGGSSMLIFLLLMILIFYFFMIRPQQKKQKKIEEARNSLQRGDKVVTFLCSIFMLGYDIPIAAAISFNEADLGRKSEAPKEEKTEENA